VRCRKLIQWYQEGYGNGTMNTTMKRFTPQSEDGFTAILITMIIMVILVLITTGFVKIIGRDQRQVVDRQQSSQAFYAAEAGINDAVHALAAGYNSDKTTCPPDGSANFPNNSNVLDSAQGISYSCLTIDHAPRSLEYASIKTDDARVIMINGLQDNGTTPQRITHLRISWEAENGSPSTTFRPAGSATSSNNLPPIASWGANVGMLRIALTPLSSYSRDNLIDNTFTTFFYPQLRNPAGGIGAATYIRGSGNRVNQGPIVSGECNTANTPRKCNVDINLSSINESSFMLVLRSIYMNAAVSISGYNGAGFSTPIRIGGAQSLVDSTGKAFDVLRRVQVRVPSRNDYAYPAGAINSGDDVCKQYSLMPDIVGFIPANQSETNCSL
jgi:hypothetical protein